MLGIAHGVEVHGDAEGRAHLVLAAVALADGAGLVEVQHPLLGQVLVDLAGGLGELLAQGQDGGLVGRQGRVQVQHHADVVLLRVHDLLVVGVHQHGQDAALHAQRGLDHIGDVALVGLGVEVGQVLAGHGLVLGQVVVGTVGHAPQLAPAEGKQELEVRGGLGVEAQLLGVVVTQAEVLILQSDAQQPVVAEGAPVVEPLQVGAGLAEELQLHLLELADAEDEVARGDLVAEGLADLADAEGQLAAGGALGVHKVGEDALGRLGTEIDGVLGVLGDALERLEHQVELADIGEVVLAAAGAGDVVLLHKVLHLLLGEGVDGLAELKAVLVAPVLDEFVGAEALLALLAVHQRIGEAGQMAAGYPGLGVHEDGGVLPHVVGVLLDKFLPPGLLDVVLQLHAQGAVVPGVGQAAVDLAAGKDDAAVFAEGDDLVHRFFGVFHGEVPPI